jgi:hypothetical protein
MQYIFTSTNSVHHRRFGSLRGACEKQGRTKGHIKRTWNCVHRHNQESFGLHSKLPTVRNCSLERMFTPLI